MASTAAIRKVYRDLAHIIRQMPEKDKMKGLEELRTSFRRPLASTEGIEDRLKQAEDRASFLRITTVKTRPRGESGTWVYKDGKKLENENATIRDATGKVVSNWDGKNLDPESVKRHKQQLHRAGFVNNVHAKGFF